MREREREREREKVRMSLIRDAILRSCQGYERKKVSEKLMTELKVNKKKQNMSAKRRRDQGKRGLGLH